jgi:hypothetical protein
MRPIILRGVDAGVKIHSHRAGTLDNATIDWFLAALSLDPWMGDFEWSSARFGAVSRAVDVAAHV